MSEPTYMEKLMGSFASWLWSVLVNMSLRMRHMESGHHEIDLFLSGQATYMDFLHQSS